jgi:eukaryotic-like serine/threonine-protein kinase
MPENSSARWEEIKELLHRAMQLAPAERGPLLDDACGSDTALRAEVQSLLEADAALDERFLRSSPQIVEWGDDPAASAAAGGLEAGQLFGQRYRLVRRLGEGGMGQVWLAEQTSPVQRQVALKLIRAGMYDESVVQRFHAERQSLSIMDHPAIAKVFDAGATPQGQPYLVMEYVPGVAITEYCDQQKLSIADRLELFIQACEGVQHAHQKAIIHRDLKPANILVVPVDRKPVPRIIDFGLAKAVTAAVVDQNLLTRFGQFIGTPGYMSPEQVDPSVRDIDTRSDVYSLGVILYVLLTGKQPFEKRRRRLALDEWMRQLREEEPPTPSVKVTTDRGDSSATASARGIEPKRLVGALRGDLDAIAMKALARDRERRYGTPSELAADLRRYLNHEAILARPASSAYKLGKFIRRHRLAAAAAGTVTTLAIVAAGAGLIAVRKQRDAQYQAEQALQAQSRLLTQAAVQRLRDSDVAGAQGIILEVLTNPGLAQAPTQAAIGAFQDIRAADVERGVLSGHGSSLTSAAYSPDGSRIATASGDKTARIWDARSGAQLVVLTGHEDIVNSAGYSPDGMRVLTASNDKTARIWDAHTGAQLAVLRGHDDSVESARYSPDGAQIVTASDDRTVCIWDALTGARVAVLSGHGGIVYSAAYSPDGTRIVSASDDRSVRIWDARTHAQLASLKGHGDIVYSAAYSPDGTRIVSASFDKTARIWDARSGAQQSVLSGHGGIVYSAAYSPDGSRIVSASGDKTARIWDARTGALLSVLPQHNGQVNGAAYSPDGSRIVTASFDRTARIWDARSGAQQRVLSGHGGYVNSAAYSPDGTHVLTASNDKTARIWDARSGAQQSVLLGHDGIVYCAAYSPDGSRVVTASGDKTARIWDARTGAPLATLGHDNFVSTAAYSPDGAHIVTASFDKTARIWDAQSGAQRAVLAGHSGYVYSAAYSPDGTRIVTAADDNTARVWDARSGAQLATLTGHAGTVYAAIYSPDGQRIVTASLDKTARIWDARTGAQLAVLSGHSGSVESVAYSPDGKVIVTASGDRTARIWDATTGTQLGVLLGHGDHVSWVAFSPDGAHVVTASGDGTARIWDARIQASVATQIMWDASAQTDPLSEVDRAQLGIPHDSRERSWPQASVCDRTAAAFYDPSRLSRGALPQDITLDIAKPACSREAGIPDHAARTDYQLGRTLAAGGDANGARRRFEIAAARGYLAADIDLADLSDPARARSLYEQAWRDGVSIAAFRLGSLYEHEARFARVSRNGVVPEPSAAWRWYQLGADAGDPNALARFAERQEQMALAEPDSSRSNAEFLRAFSLYAAAAEHAREEDWPDDAWSDWRFRRASLARLLAQEGMMQPVADAYAAILDKRNAHPPSLWQAIQTNLHR